MRSVLGISCHNLACMLWHPTPLHMHVGGRGSVGGMHLGYTAGMSPPAQLCSEPYHVRPRAPEMTAKRTSHAAHNQAYKQPKNAIKVPLPRPPPPSSCGRTHRASHQRLAALKLGQSGSPEVQGRHCCVQQVAAARAAWAGEGQAAGEEAAHEASAHERCGVPRGSFWSPAAAGRCHGAAPPCAPPSSGQAPMPMSRWSCRAAASRQACCCK